MIEDATHRDYRSRGLLQPIAAGYFDDLLGWAAIGARTTNRRFTGEMASELDLPVGFKNGTDGTAWRLRAMPCAAPLTAIGTSAWMNRAIQQSS